MCYILESNLDEQLRMMGSGDGNILQENMFVIFTSTPMIALFRVCSILHVAICIPMRWLAGNTHTLKEYNWSIRSMGRALDILESSLHAIISDHKLILNKTFMMDIFSSLREELPPFHDFLEYKFEKQQTKVIGNLGECAALYLMLCEELFDPRQESNIESNAIAEELGGIVSKALLTELHDPKKATFKYLSSSGLDHSWKHTPKEVHEALLGMMAVNDPSERTFGMGTRELQVYGRIGLSNAFCMGDAKVNGDMRRQLNIGEKTKATSKNGLMHELSHKLHTSLMIVCMTDLPKKVTTKPLKNNGMQDG